MTAPLVLGEQRELLGALCECYAGHATVAWLSRYTGWPARRINRVLSRLLERGLVTRATHQLLPNRFVSVTYCPTVVGLQAMGERRAA